MIHIDAEKNMIEVKGTGATLYSEIGIVLRDFVKKGIIDREKADYLIDEAFKSDEEMHEEFLEKISFLRDMFGDILDANKREDKKDGNAAMEILKDAMKKEWDK